jgi:hypothetical protein
MNVGLKRMQKEAVVRCYPGISFKGNYRSLVRIVGILAEI